MELCEKREVSADWHSSIISSSLIQERDGRHVSDVQHKLNIVVRLLSAEEREREKSSPNFVGNDRIRMVSLNRIFSR